MNGIPEIGCENDDEANEEGSDRSDEENLSSNHHDKTD
jgi:hypothetical protein